MIVVNAILGFLTALPEIIKLIGETFKLINEYRAKQQLQELKEAMAVARRTGDTSRLDAAFNVGKKNETAPVSKP